MVAKTQRLRSFAKDALRMTMFDRLSQAKPKQMMSGAKKIRAMVVDDEPVARSNLRALLQRETGVELVGECGSGKEALEEIRKKKPELVFLDVQMPEWDGFDVLERLGGDVPAALVFVTAYDEYALKAFEAGALDYLLKPFTNARFEKTLARAKERIALGQSSTSRVERLAIKSAAGMVFVKISDIDWVEAADYYVCLHVGARTHMLRRSMSEVEKEWQGRGFCRIHRSAIVNLERVRGLENASDGGADVVLKDGTKLPLSRRYRRALQERMSAGGMRTEKKQNSSDGQEQAT